MCGGGGATCLLVEFERVPESVQAFGLLRVRVPKRLGGRFEEVLVVAHLSYWHAVELVWKSQHSSTDGRFLYTDVRAVSLYTRGLKQIQGKLFPQL